MDVWVITRLNADLDVTEDAVTYDESAVADLYDEMCANKALDEVVIISHATAVLPWEMES
jgi:hypothetical protein